MISAKQSLRGFTLVELSVVLVIIGLIIGGVLTGQQIIQNARVTNAINSIQAYQAQFQTYVQNYGALPGDDPSANTRFPNSSVPDGGTNGNGDGVIQGSFDSSLPHDESRLLWAHMRAAGLVKNQVTNNTSAVQPPNPFNGIFGIQNGAFGNGFTTPVLCLNNIPASAAEAIDSRLDDGNSNGGGIEAMVSTGTVGEAVNGTLAANYGLAQTYTLCIRM